MVEGHLARGPRHRAPLPAITIGDYLAAVAAPRATLPRRRSATRRDALTYAELALDVERVACGLLALGIEKGDRIAIWAPDSTEWTLVQLAAARAGAVLVILDGEWSTRSSLARPCVESERPAARCGRRRTARAAGGGARRAGARSSGSWRSTGCPCGGSDDLTWGELLVAGSAVDPARLAEREAALHPDDPVSIEYERLAGGELAATDAHTPGLPRRGGRVAHDLGGGGRRPEVSPKEERDEERS